ncbi:MAG: hypothetical protein WC556_07990 [Candidatus Methanoperedens sp.]
MESVKIECEGNKMIFEGELDPEIMTTNLGLGFHVQNEETYKSASLEIKANAEIDIGDLEKMYAWINKNSKVSIDVKECSKWKITLERLP